MWPLRLLLVFSALLLLACGGGDGSGGGSGSAPPPPPVNMSTVSVSATSMTFESEQFTELPPDQTFNISISETQLA